MTIMDEVLAERYGPVLVCRLNCPETLNGLTGSLLRSYLAALEQARVDDSVRVVVTTGEGTAFSAGADMSELTGETAERGLNALMHENLGVGERLGLADRYYDRLGIGREVLALRDYDKPLIAAINGPAAGGGFALAMLHDIRFASERARFTTAFVHIGLVGEMGLSYTLPRAVGLEAAMDLFLTGRQVDAQEAHTLGLVRRVVAHDGLMDEVLAYADSIAEKPAIAGQFTKKVLQRSWDNTLAAQLDMEWPYQVAAFETRDTKEGIAAFIERRPPRFVGG